MLNRITPVVLNIVILNVLVFLFIQLNQSQFDPQLEVESWNQYFLLYKSGLIWESHAIVADLFMPIQLVSSMFSHYDLMHILFNMFTLVSLGSAVEMVMGSRNFAGLYLFSGLFGTVITWLFDPSIYPVLGASGALFGIVVAFAYYYPHARLSLLFLPIGFKARYLAIGAAVISLVFLAGNLLFPDQRIFGFISHFGHLAGMLGGFLYINRNRFLDVFKGK